MLTCDLSMNICHIKGMHLSPCRKPAVAGAFMQMTQFPASSSSLTRCWALPLAAGAGAVAGKERGAGAELTAVE